MYSAVGVVPACRLVLPRCPWLDSALGLLALKFQHVFESSACFEGLGFRAKKRLSLAISLSLSLSFSLSLSLSPCVFKCACLVFGGVGRAGDVGSFHIHRFWNMGFMGV